MNVRPASPPRTQSRPPRPNRALRAGLTAAAVVAAAAGPAHGYVDTHLNELSAPIAAEVDSQIAALEALPAPTKTEKKRLASLKGLERKLDRTATRLAQDFAEVNTAAAAFRKLGTAGAVFDASLDAAAHRASIALQERDDTIGDLRLLVPSIKERGKIDSARTKARTIRSSAEALTDRADRARLQLKAEAAFTGALKLAEKYARKTGAALPPVRLRSGDAAGRGGARIVVPFGTGTPIDGAAVLFPPDALSGPQTVTLSHVADFVGGRDTVAGPAVRIDAGGAEPGVPLRVWVPAAPPAGSDAANLAVFRDETGEDTPLTGREIETDGTIAGDTSALGTFQAAVQAAPLGAPDGTYAVCMFGASAKTDRTIDAPEVGVAAGIGSQDLTFRRDRTGSATTGGFITSSRAFTGGATHHTDLASNTVAGAYTFTWSPGPAGRFAFPIDLGGGASAAAEGVAASEGGVIAFTGHGGTFDFFAVGVRTGAGVTASDLIGRWTGAELVVEFADSAAQPFRTRWSTLARDFRIGADAILRPEASTAGFAVVTEYRTQLADPVHALSAEFLSGAPEHTLSITADGRFIDSGARMRGVFSKPLGLLVLGIQDTTTQQVRFLVAARQAASVAPGTFQGTWNTARFDLAFASGQPDTRSSSFGFSPRTGTFIADVNGDATDSLLASNRFTYTVRGVPPLAASDWTVTASSAAVAPGEQTFPLVLDGTGGNHRGGEPVWYSVSDDGSFLFGSVRSGTTDGPLGILFGVR